MLKWLCGMGRLCIRSINIIFIITFFLIFTCIGIGQTVNVPLTHPIYDILERWETQGFIENTYNHTKPFSREEVAVYLKEVFEKYTTNPERFSSVDEQYLRYFASEFSEELQKLETNLPDYSKTNRFYLFREKRPLSSIWPKFLYANNRNLLSKNYKDFSIYIDPLGQISNDDFLSDSDSIKTVHRISNGFLFRGNLGDNFGFYFMLTDNHIWQDPDFQRTEVIEESGFPYLQFGDDRAADFDENVAYLTFKYKYFYLLYGRDYNQWGVGHKGNLMLSTNAPIYDQIKLMVRYWRFKITHITAAIQYVPPAARESIKSAYPIDVYWAGNRFEFYLGKGVQVGFAESIVYGNRSLQIGYLNPLAFFKSIEHYYGDRDNGAISFDASWRVFPGIKIYGEWFIDDIITTKLGSDWFGNKFGYQTGIFIVDPFKLPGLDALVEYSRVKPYVYGHSLNDYNKYKNYDTILGHYIGSNSDDWFIRLRYYAHRRLRLQLDFENYRHGKNDSLNVGGDPDFPFRFGVDNEDVQFLNGDRIYRTVLGGEVQYELLRNLFLSFKYHQIESDKVEWEPIYSFQVKFNFGYRNESAKLFEPAKF
jgi:hypothetical protein